LTTLSIELGVPLFGKQCIMGLCSQQTVCLVTTSLRSINLSAHIHDTREYLSVNTIQYNILLLQSQTDRCESDMTCIGLR